MNYQNISQDKPIRICFLGCGHITKSHAKSARNADKNVRLSFASRNITKAEDYKKKFKGANAYSSYDEAIMSEDEDIIMINTPPDSHFELAKKAVLAGKHIIIEKPPFFNSSDFDVIGKLSEQRGLQFMIAENYYYKPLRKTIHKTLEEGLIGDPLFVQINATKKQASKNDWRDDKSITGFGALFEGGIHWVNFINNIGLTIIRVQGFLPKQMTELERSIQLTAETEEGVIINLLYSWEVDTIFKGLRLSKIYGREGSISFETNGIFVIVRGKRKRILFPGLKHIGGSQLMFNDFMTSIRNGQSPAFDWQMAKKDLELIEEVYHSIKK